MANKHLSYDEFKNIFGDLGVTEWTKYNWLDNNFNLPSNLCRVEYIESTGTEYIDTGYQFSSNDYSIEEKFYWVASVGSFFGANSSTSNYDLVPYGSFANVRHWIAGSSSVMPITSSYKLQDINEVRYVVDNGTLTATVNGDNYSDTYEGSAVSGKNFYVFAKNGNGGATEFSKHRVYYFKMYEGGNLVRSLVPVFDTTTGKYGLYDLVGRQFYGNAGTGDFTGPKVFAFTEANEANIKYYGVFQDYQTFYIDIGSGEDYVLTFESATTNNDYYLVDSVGNFGYRPQQINPDWNINRCYVFFIADNEAAAKQMLKDNPVVIYLEK